MSSILIRGQWSSVEVSGRHLKDTRVEEKALGGLGYKLSGAANQTRAESPPTEGRTWLLVPEQSGRLQRLALRQPLLFFAAAAIIGVLADSMLDDSNLGQANRAVVTFWFVLVAIGLLAIFWRRPWARFDAVRPMCTVLVVVPLAALLHHGGKESYRSASLLGVAGDVEQPAILEGTVDLPAVLRRHPLADQPSRRQRSPWQTQVEITVRRLRIGHAFEDLDGRVLLVIDGRRDELRPGDDVRVYGTMQRFSAPTNPGQRDLRAVYQTRRLHARVDIDSEDQIVLIGTTSGGLVRVHRMIASIAAVGRELLLNHTSDQSGPLAVALVIGQRDFVDRNTRDMLLVTGTAHLLSVSGLHLAIVVVLANWAGALLRMPPWLKMLWIIGICFLYTAITGGRPPVMRASVLVGTFMFAIWMRRPSQPINTLSLAAIMLIFLNPELVFSIGVQLSFLAVATLVLCGQLRGTGSPADEQAVRQQQRLESLVESSRSPAVRLLRYMALKLGQLIWFSACVTAISTPLVWHHFHVVSPVSVLANVVLGPFLFLSLAAGVATVVLGWVFDPLAIVPGYVCDFSLWAMRGLIETAASIPLGHFWLPAPPAWWVGLFYIVITATLCLRPCRMVSWIRYGWIAGWVLIALALSTNKTPLPEGTLEATFVDVGHGTSVVLRFAKDDVWLYDCGRLGNDTGSSRDIDVTLWSLGVTELRGVFLSHADADHFNALPGVLRRFGVRQIFTPPGVLDEPEPALVAVRRAIDEARTPVREIAARTEFSASGHTMVVLHPPPRRLRGSDNANSLVLRIDCGGTTLILPGDLEPPGTESLINHDRPPPGGVLMAPHHGSLAMDASSVLQWSRPSETIVSGGRRARRPEVHDMLSITGSGVHVTSEVGAVRMRIDRQGSIEVRSWTASRW